MEPPVSQDQESKAAAEVTLEDEANEGIDFIKEDVQNKIPFALVGCHLIPERPVAFNLT